MNQMSISLLLVSKMYFKVQAKNLVNRSEKKLSLRRAFLAAEFWGSLWVTDSKRPWGWNEDIAIYNPMRVVKG